MVQKQRDKYLSLRREFEPATVTLVIIAESPPISGKYFYNPDGQVSEPLFNALVKQLRIQPKTKLEGLREFQKQGWLLVDATYEPVNAYDSHHRDRVIHSGYPELCTDLKRLLGARWSEIPLTLIKANVCRLLEPKLKEDGFDVLNEGRVVPFPASGHQRTFDRLFREIARQILHGEAKGLFMTELTWVSGGVRLIKMMVELHRRGFQKLRICPYEYPLAWRLEVAPSSYFSTSNGAYLKPGGSAEPARHSSANEFRYFGWEGVESFDPERLAKEFTERFPQLCEAGSGRDWEYAGWLSELSGHVSRTRQLPFVVAEYFEPEPDKLTYLPLRDYERGGEVFEFPLPPSTSPRDEALIQERDELRVEVGRLRKKISLAVEALKR